jgi:MYXO-CTERM domain-containing protein
VGVALGERDRPAAGRVKVRRRDWLLLLALAGVLAAAFTVRYPLVYYNVPVAAHVDERAGLVLLYRMEAGTFNPAFFNYPTFYYYLTFFLTRPFASTLVAGRLLNLFFAGGLAVATYLLAAYLFRARAAGLAAAAFALFSPILIMNGSYIITDILMTLLVVLALLSFSVYFRRGADADRYWLLGVICSGLALSTKYSAAVLVPAYLLAEGTARGKKGASRLDRPLPHLALPLACLGAAALLLAVTFWLPQSFFLEILRSGGDVDSVIDASDVAFIARIRRLLLLGGLLLAPLALFLLRFPGVARRLSRVRLLLALLLIGLVFLLGTPYALVSWQQFLYDVGHQLKVNQGGPSAYWRYYLAWYHDWESDLLLVFAALGLGGYWLRRRRQPEMVLLFFYALLYAVAIGTATRGFVRYLTPLLPLIFAFAGYGLWLLGRRLADGGLGRYAAGFVLLLALVAVGVEVQTPARRFLSRVGRMRCTTLISVCWRSGRRGSITLASSLTSN